MTGEFSRTSLLSGTFVVAPEVELDVDEREAVVRIRKERIDCDFDRKITEMVGDGREYVIKLGDWFRIPPPWGKGACYWIEYVRHGVVCLKEPFEAEIGELVAYGAVVRAAGTYDGELKIAHLFDGPVVPIKGNGEPVPEMFLQLVNMVLDDKGDAFQVFQRVK